MTAEQRKSFMMFKELRRIKPVDSLIVTLITAYCQQHNLNYDEALAMVHRDVIKLAQSMNQLVTKPQS